MKEKQLQQNVDNETLELILCKISSAVCETERISENFNELKKRYIKALRELSIANEVNNLLKKKIEDLKFREASLMGQLRQNTEFYSDEIIDEHLIN